MPDNEVDKIPGIRYGLPSPSDAKQFDHDEVSKEIGWNLENLPQGEDSEQIREKSKFLPKGLEAIMMFAICTALFGELRLPRLVVPILMGLPNSRWLE
jgi:hypothetical protein